MTNWLITNKTSQTVTLTSKKTSVSQKKKGRLQAKLVQSASKVRMHGKFDAEPREVGRDVSGTGCG